MGSLILLGLHRVFNDFNHPVRLVEQMFDHMLEPLWKGFLVFRPGFRANGTHQDGFGIYRLFRMIVDAHLSVCIQAGKPDIRINGVL